MKTRSMAQENASNVGPNSDLGCGLFPAAVCKAIAVAMVCGMAFTAPAQAITIGGPFELTAADGTTVTETTYADKWLLVFFGYTFCPDICPTTLMVIADALEHLGDDADLLQPIFITVDPERDTPEIMGNYAASFDDRIVGLSGTKEQVEAVAAAYGAYYKAQKDDLADPYYSVDHSTYLYIMDPDGKFVRGLDHDTPGPSIAETFRDLIQQP